MKKSTDLGKTWGPLTLVVGPKAHTGADANFTSRNPYATVTSTGDIV